MPSSASRSVVVHAASRRAASTIATKYSSAVYNAALAKSPATLDKVASELGAISSVLTTSPELTEYTVLDTLFSKSAGNAKNAAVSDITKNLFTVLADNGRLGETPGVIEGFNELFAEYKGELNVVVTSATPLTKEILSRLETSLKQSQAASKSKVLKVTNKVNPTILGGLVVDFGDKSIDLSVQSRVNKLNQVLQRVLSHIFSLVPIS
ncbi:OSCP, subunit 5 of the stator stalk of mitochondrial F1F0 ATP synthase [Flagelloscypha sp. PMI_526]|nr:OSCP, subunit 5 of the stator stalk of mitochondrial F1F0 ATP synthase [Flagelloscypha sp. PMI_526]